MAYPQENLMSLYKFGSLYSGDGEEYVYPNTWRQEATTGPERLVIAPASGQIELLRKLTAVLPEPFGLLYVLVVPRSNGVEGRYQSPQTISRAELEQFLSKFRDYFEKDGRHHLWVRSLPASSTLVYDRHNVIYAYGPLEDFKQVLVREELQEGDISIPDPHIHHYHAEFDSTQEEIMAYWGWLPYPLTEQDN